MKLVGIVSTVPYHDLGRAGDDSGPDVFGRHWPMEGERDDMLPPELLRVGIQYSDGRTATSISGYDSPASGAAMWHLSGGGRGSAHGSLFHQGYWISPLPSAGSVAIVCEWPAVDLPEVRVEIAAELLLAAADRSSSLFCGGRVVKDDREWRLETNADVDWITRGTAAGRRPMPLIPPVFSAYGTLKVPGPRDRAELIEHEKAVVEILSAETPEQPWWLGYRDNGPGDVVFPYTSRATAYYGWEYVLLEAGPDQAASWRAAGFVGALPDLMFPADHSWLVSGDWSDYEISMGGSVRLVDRFVDHPNLGARVSRVPPEAGGRRPA